MLENRPNDALGTLVKLFICCKIFMVSLTSASKNNHQTKVWLGNNNIVIIFSFCWFIVTISQKVHLQIYGDNRKGEHLHTEKVSSSQRPFLPKCLADDAQRLLNFHFQASEIFYNIISLGLDSPTFFSRGPTSAKTKGKRKRRCRIGGFMLLVKV